MAQCSNTEFYNTRSFVDNKQKEFCLLSTLESLVLQSEQYHPVAQTHLHKGLKCKVKIITSVRPQNTAAIQLAWVYTPGSLFLMVLVHKSLGTRLGYKEASRMPMSSRYERF